MSSRRVDRTLPCFPGVRRPSLSPPTGAASRCGSSRYRRRAHTPTSPARPASPAPVRPLTSRTPPTRHRWPPTPLDPDTAALLSPVPPVAYPPSASTRSDQPPSPEAGDPASPFPGDDRLSARQDDQPTVMLATVDAITWPYASQLPVDAAGFHQIQDATVEALLPDLPRQAGASAELMESVAGQPDLAAAVLQTLVEAAAAEAVAQRLTGVDREVLADLGISGGDWVQPGQVRGYADAFAELRDRYETAVDGIPEGSAQREATRITQAFDRAVTAQARQVGMPLTQFVHVRDTYQQLHALIGDVGRQTPPVDGPEVFIVTIADPDDAAAQPDTAAHTAARAPTQLTPGTDDRPPPYPTADGPPPYPGTGAPPPTATPAWAGGSAVRFDGGVVLPRAGDAGRADRHRRWMSPGGPYAIVVDQPEDLQSVEALLDPELAWLNPLPSERPLMVGVFGEAPATADGDALRQWDESQAAAAHRVRQRVDELLRQRRVAVVLAVTVVGDR